MKMIVGKKGVDMTMEPKYSMADLKKMSYPDLINLLVSIEINQITDILEFNQDAYDFYIDSNRVQYMIDELELRGPLYTAEDNKGIPTLSEVVRGGFYLAYYFPKLGYLKERDYREKCFNAILAIQRNSNYKLGKITQNYVIRYIGKLIGNTACNVEIVNNTVDIFKEFNKDINKNSRDITMKNALNDLMDGIYNDLTSYVFQNNVSESETPWYGKIDEYLEIISAYALTRIVTDDNNWIFELGLTYTAKLNEFSSNPKSIRGKLDEGLKVYPYLSHEYFRVISTILEFYYGKLVNGTSLDMEKIKEDAKKKYLPNRYNFDDATIKIMAGDKIDRDKIEKLYWAAKEVQAQYFRVIGSDKVLDEGNVDDVLTIVIYNNVKEYKLNSIIYGYVTGNAGIYVEKAGTCFTFESKTAESIELETVFRHEYVHYLQGRYLISGLRGESGFYEGGDKLFWYTEGTAEFFEGATRKNNALSRKEVVRLLRDSQSDIVTIDRLLQRSYASVNTFFYYQAATFIDYIYNEVKEILMYINKCIITNDVYEYERYIKKLRRDSKLNDEYQGYIKGLIDSYDTLTDPSVSEDYLKSYPSIETDKIKDDIQSIVSLSNTQIVVKKSCRNDNITLRGVYIGGVSNGEISDWKEMNNFVNECLNELDALEWQGYKTFTAYFVDYRVNSNNRYEFELVFTGVFPKRVTGPRNPKAKIEINKKEVRFIGENSLDENGCIVKYEWDFGDGSMSTEINPIHIYKETGNFDVTLKVTDNEGLIGIDSDTVSIEEESTIEYQEKEPNDSFKQANPIMLDNNYLGVLDYNDYIDIFEFEIQKASDIKVAVENIDKIRLNWVVVSADNTSKYILYQQEVQGNTIIGRRSIEKIGKYYLIVYKNSNVYGRYKFKISTMTSAAYILEQENNDYFDKANKINLKEKMKGSLDSKDTRDCFVIDIKTDMDINITLTKLNEFGVGWLAYKDDNLERYVFSPQSSKPEVSGKYRAKAGRYYLLVYLYNSEGEYLIEIK